MATFIHFLYQNYHGCTMESFGEALQKLKEVYKQEVKGWQEKMLGLTNQKNTDAKRIEELLGRNQQLRDQQRSLTENIKQLENRLRAGLCDRCIVTQDVANRRQQEYEKSQLQSLQHISTLGREIATLRRDNKRLYEEVKNLRTALRNQNGRLAETASPEVKRSPTPGSPLSLLLSAAQMSTASPTGGTVQKSEAGHSGLSMTEDSKSVDGMSQPQSFELSQYNTPPLSQPSPLTEAWRTVQNIGRKPPAPQRRARSTDASESLYTASMLLLKNNPFNSTPTTPVEKWGSSKVHAPIPYRPQPIKTHKFPQPWQLPDNPDWVTMSVMAEGGTVIHHNPKMLQLPTMIHSTSHQSTQERVLSAQRFWANLNPAMKGNEDAPRSLSEHDEGVTNMEETARSRPASASETSQSWKTADAVGVPGEPGEGVDGVPDDIVDNETPLDLSESGRAKAVKSPWEAPVKATPPADSPSSSSSSSSPPTPSSSSLESPGSQSEQRLGEFNLQNCVSPIQDATDEDVLAAENSKTDEIVDLCTGKKKPKVSAFTLSLQPVVVLENMKRSLCAQNPSDGWVTRQEKEKEEWEDEVEEEEQSNQRKRLRLEQESLQPPGLIMEKRARMGGRPKEKRPEEQG
ncbi:RBBP8 N-terminal-like protein isoform X3 [Alosa sapidissima]|uniref:RBBP8 N-terminal-like protein isoform X3 n=1 Tax=Alosa sapidissima TaxID=34773 RepID=UPI001C0918A7|nr:RBBP8 N-terminal-like protein isoform X3 [Alosa sapidissima]XP_041954623.1 RBBP8 N-terminal-like protein isoform X3 [Alosa sapidissima]